MEAGQTYIANECLAAIPILQSAMHLQRIGLTALITVLATLLNVDFGFPVLGQLIQNPKSKIQNSQVLAQTPDARKVEADRLFRQGSQQYDKSQFEPALRSWQQALIIYREIKDRQSEGIALSNLGITYYALGDYAKAIEYHQQSLVIAREIKDREGEGHSLGSLGNVYFSLGDYAKAIEYHQQSLAIAREIKYPQLEGASLGSLGGAYYALANNAKAIEYYQQSLAIAREIKYPKLEGILWQIWVLLTVLWEITSKRLSTTSKV